MTISADLTVTDEHMTGSQVFHEIINALESAKTGKDLKIHISDIAIQLGDNNK